MARVNKIEIVINAEDKASRVLGGVGKALGGIGKIAAGASVAVVGAAAGIGVALGGLAMQAAPLEGIGLAFDKMADRVGLSLDELREASAGTVSDFELMRKANIALTGAGEDLGVEFGKNLPKLMEAARAAAKATGQDVDFLFESLVTGIKRGSPMLIDNTGLVVKLGEANEAMAKKLGKTVQELTAEEKSIALMNATVEAGTRMVDEFGGGVLTAAEQLAQFRAKSKNVKDQIGLALLPALSALLDVLNKTGSTGPMLIEWAQAIGKWLADRIPVWVDMATASFQKFLKAIRLLSMRAEWAKQAFSDLLFIFESLAMGAPGDIPWEDFFPPEIADTAYALSDAFEILRDIIIGVDWSVPLENFLAIVRNIGAVFQKVWPNVAGVFLTVSEIIKAAALVIVDIFQNQVLPPLQEAFANLTEAVGKLGLDWSDVWSALWKATKIVAYAIGAIILGLIGALTAVITAIANVAAHITAVMSDMVDTFFKGLEAISKLVGGAMAVIRGIFTGDLELIMAGLRAWREGLFELFVALGEGLINAVRLIFGTIIEAVLVFISTFINFFIGLKETLVGGSIVQDMMDAMYEIIQSALAAILDAILTFIADVIGAFSDMASAMYEVGVKIMKGLESGIMSKLKSILKKVRDIVKEIKDAAKEAFGIGSPSTVFAEIGRQMMEGMALGITASAGLPAMAAAGAGIGAARAVTNNYYFSQTVNTRATADVTIQSFESARAMVG